MPTDLTSILSCTYGASVLDLVSYSVQYNAVTAANIGRTGTSVQVTAQCELRMESAVGLGAAVQSVIADLEVDGRDFIVTGLAGETELSLNAAGCMDGGPFISWEMTDGDSPASKKFKLTITGSLILGDLNKNIPKDSYVVTVALSPDGLQTITRTGQLSGANAKAYFLATTLPAMRTAYPPPGWVTDLQYGGAFDGVTTTLSYQITARQNFGDLPATDNATSVSGDATVRVERDERQRKTTIYDFDLVVIGDPFDLLAELRPTQGLVLRESYTLTTIVQQKLTASFTLLASADADRPNQVDWQASVRITQSTTVYEEKSYIGAAPILVAKPATLGRLIYSGSATGLGVYPDPPDPPMSAPATAAEITYDSATDAEKKTQWTQQFFAVDDSGEALPEDFLPDLSLLDRTAQPPAGENA